MTPDPPWCPHDEFHAFRSDIEGNLLRTLDMAGDLGVRVRAASRADRFFGTADLHNWFRKPFGSGWALVGDAGLATDPVTGRGIADAFRDAELVADAIADGLGGRRPLAEALAGYEQTRNKAALPMYEFTTQLASFAPPAREEEVLFKALATRDADADRFLGVITGAVPMSEYFTPQNLMQLIGARGMISVALSRFSRWVRPHPLGAPVRPPRAVAPAAASNARFHVEGSRGPMGTRSARSAALAARRTRT